MKKLFVSLSLVLILSLALSGLVLAQSTTKTLSTNFTLVNLSETTDATVNVDYFKDTGAGWDAADQNESFTILQDFGQKIVAQYFDTTMTAGKGSAVVSSNTPLGAVVQIQARNQTASNGAYTGLSEGANKYYVPIVLIRRGTQQGTANTQLIIQNLDPADATDVTVQLIAGPGSGFSNYTAPVHSIPASSSWYYDLQLENNVPTQWYGAAVITAEAGKDIGAVVNIFIGSHALQTFNAFPETNVGTSWSIPQFTSKLTNSLSTPVSFQNLGAEIPIGGADLVCKSTISTPAEISFENTTAVPTNASYAFSPVGNAAFPNNWSGSCVLTTSSNVVAYVQMRFPGANDQFGAYEAFLSDGTDTTVIVPLVSKRQSNGFATAVTVQNLSADTANVTLTYTPAAAYVDAHPGAAPITFNTTIAGNGNLIQNHRLTNPGLPVGVTMPDGWYGTLKVESTNGKALVGFVQLTFITGLPGDTFMAHSAFMLP